MAEQVDPMEFRDTDNPATIERYHAINDGAGIFYRLLLHVCPKSAERTLAIRKLQEARMWANAAVALEGCEYER